RTDHPVIERWTGPLAVVHGTNFVVPPTRGAAAIMTVHDLTPVRFPEMCTVDTLAYPGLLRRGLGRGAWVHTPSAFVAAEVVSHFGADPERVVAIAPGIPGGPTAAAGATAGSAGRSLSLLALGTIEPRKDHVTLVRAFDALAGRWPDLQLVLAGAPGWGTAAVADAVAGARHRDRIVSLGWVSEPVRARLMGEATVFVFPSRYEGFGFPPLEAMRAGIPVVATCAGSLPEVLGDAARLVSPGDAEELADAIDCVLSDESERARLAAAGVARAASFSWDSYAIGMAGLYRRAAAER
ncbi:MAG: glycosyltransferase family 4 protein, partial [Acidimicrobiales bacterium]